MEYNNVRNFRPPISQHSPSLWGDTFTFHALDDEVQNTYANAIEELKGVAKKMLVSAKSYKLMILVDTLERLGLAYLFEKEIDDKLQEIYDFLANGDDHNLLTTSLAFRLLRQHQYHVSCDVFHKFVDKQGRWIKSVSSDIEGLLNLYEASHVRIHGEEILQEALVFIDHHLTTVLPQLKSPLKDKLKRALQQPLHRGVQILETRLYIIHYGSGEGINELLLKLAKLNFKFLQNLYKEELSKISMWWNKFDLKSKLPFVRDRMVEFYLSSVLIHFEPKYSEARMAMAKSMQLITMMDDTYDNYATLDEAKLFNNVLESWDMANINKLPDKLQILYQFIMSICEDYKDDAAKNDKLFAVPYFREKVIELNRANLKDVTWIMEKQMPSFEEYIKNSIVTIGLYLMFTSMVPTLKSSTKQTMIWFMSEPRIVISCAKLARHLDDLASHQRENKEGKVLTVVDYYMKQHGVSKQETLSKFMELVEDEWKKLNKEWLLETSIPKEVVEQFMNFARMAHVVYKNNEDGYTNPEKNVASIILALFVDPMEI